MRELDTATKDEGRNYFLRKDNNINEGVERNLTHTPPQ